ncbi:MAG: Na+ dependent nucleoside transporter N-terminal domain-containing protein [Planctomycetaceae bacterium]
MTNLQGLLGIATLLGLAVLMSNNRRRIPWKLVAWGLALQFVFALLILRSPVGEPFFRSIDSVVNRLIDFSNAGSTFVFKPLNAFYQTKAVVLPADSDRQRRRTRNQTNPDVAPESDGPIGDPDEA